MPIEAADIRKEYRAPAPPHAPWRRGRPVRALDGVSLRLGAGEITGLAGPNGAGKSTLLRVLGGRLVPDSGRIFLNGRGTGDAELRKAAVCAEAGARSFYPRLSVIENLCFFGALYGLPRSGTRARAETLRDRLGMRKADLELRFDSLSEGAAQKAALIRALMLPSSLLLLDEPARHLDLGSAAALAGLIKEKSIGEGAAVLYASHDPAGLAAICGRVLALKEGRISAEVPAGGEPGAIAGIAGACAGTL